MEEIFDYNQVPHDFVHCFNAQCPRAEECLRQLAGRNVQPSAMILRVVNPVMCPDAEGGFPQFRPIRKVRMAWGVREAIGRMPYKEGQYVVKALNRMYTKVTLNRITTHQRPLSPEEQKRIEALFARYGVTDGNVFDRVAMVYDW